MLTGQWLKEKAYHHWSVLNIVCQDPGFIYIIWRLVYVVHNIMKELLSKALEEACMVRCPEMHPENCIHFKDKTDVDKLHIKKKVITSKNPPFS